MRKLFREMRPDGHKSELEDSRDSIAAETTTTRNVFFKTGSESDLFAMRRKIMLIPVECGHNGKLKPEVFELVKKAIGKIETVAKSNFDEHSFSTPPKQQAV